MYVTRRNKNNNKVLTCLLQLRISDVVILMYDIGNMASFEDLNIMIEQLIRIQDVENSNELSCIVVGHKLDLTVAKRQVDSSVARKWSLSHGFAHVESSAKDDINVNCVFEDAIALALKRKLWRYTIHVKNRKQREARKKASTNHSAACLVM